MATSSGDAGLDGLRGVLMIGSSLVAGYFGFQQEVIAEFMDKLITFTFSAVALGSFLWMMYTKFRTVAVPIAVVIASQHDPNVPTIPTVSPVTGAITIGEVK